MQHYHEHRISPNDSVVQHVTNIQNLASQLKDVGQTIDKTDNIIYYYKNLSLLAKYNTLYNSVGQRFNENLNSKSPSQTAN